MMTDNLKTYRIRTDVGILHNTILNVQLNQTYDILEILSLKLDQKNIYKSYTSDYGVIVGRVQANDAVGIPNCKVSIFIPYDDSNTDVKKSILYHYASVESTNDDGVRYNLLPDEIDEACHQNVGTFPNKRLILDNKDEMEIFDQYWKYTTVTNDSGDYMLYGVPTGTQQLHVDVDFSDIGIWSQRPIDMVYKGYNLELFDSPNKFKESKNLNSLSQIYSQDKDLYVYPYWGDSNENGDVIGITRCDINIDYKFEPTCIFMGSIITDSGNNAIGKNCSADKRLGKMSNLTTGEGSIEMIRKTFDNKVEQVRIKGDRVIDGDGVWCYQIPMNLDYVKTDEYGNLVQSDDPSKGIPTRARVRFRISLDEQANDGQNRKRCKYLVPNNPHIDDPEFSETKEPDYEFGSLTRDESYCDLFWNKVYSVKNYIPRFQKKNKVAIRDYSGIKLINHYGDGINPMPYNNLTIKLNFTYRLMCVLVKLFINLIKFINEFIIGPLVAPFCVVCKALRKLRKVPIIGKLVKPLITFACAIPDAVKCISISENFCDDGVNPNKYYPGCKGCVWSYDKAECKKSQSGKSKEDRLICTNNIGQLENCVENDLAQDNEATSFNFENDWVNGVLYAPLWYRKIRKKKKFFFGLFTKKDKDQWCTADGTHSSLRLFKSCAPKREKDGTYQNFDGDYVDYYRLQGETCNDNSECQNTVSQVGMSKGLIKQKTNLLGKYIYYYSPAEYVISKDSVKEDSKGHINRLFATDIILLGSLNSCDYNGIPQFFKNLNPTTYNLPSDILFTDHEFLDSFDENGNFVDTTYTEFSEAAGCDWGNKNEYGKTDGGLFYSIGCQSIEMHPKSCVNLSRICEMGVSLDESKYVPDLNALSGNDNAYDYLRTDGFISYDELSDFDARSQFATLNGNKLKTKVNISNGLKEYDFRYLYVNNFDGSLKEIMKKKTQNYSNDINYKFNYKLEEKSTDYYIFRMGNNPYFYDKNHSFPRFENSFYFYFGLKDGKTAIEKFNSNFFSECETLSSEETSIGIKTNANSWCNEINDEYNGYVAVDLSNVSMPYSLQIDSQTDRSYQTIEINNSQIEKIILCGKYVDKDEESYAKLINDGYTNVLLKNGSNGIPNGEYLLTITDSNGDITESHFSLKASTITANISVMDFKKDNDTLYDEYSGSYCKIANDKKVSEDKSLFDDETNEVYRKIGGVIGIYNIINENSIVKNNFRIILTPIDKNVIKENDKGTELYKALTIVIDKSGILYKNTDDGTNGCGLLESKWDSENGWHFVIGVPYGGINYSVQIIQTCPYYDKTTKKYKYIDTNNSVTYTSKVDEPTSYKLFVNDIDISVIQKGFKTGWVISGNSDKISIKQQGNLSGWLNISDENNLNDYGNGQTLFEWDKNELYKKETYGYDKTESEDSSVNVEAKSLVKEARQEFISLMKDTFYLNCSEDSKTINVYVQTDSYPYDTAIIYKEEETKEDEEISYNVISCDNTFSRTDTVSGIEIPTITYKDDLTYGNGTIIKGNASYTLDSKSGCKKDNRYKSPYFIACVNADGDTIPHSKVGKAEENDKFILSGDISGYFGFHIIDKRFKSDYVAWAYINNIPYFKPTDIKYYGKTIKMNGLLAGYVYNGTISSKEGNNVKFEEQTFGAKTLTIENIDTNEDSIPTRRIMYDSAQSPYLNYIVTTSIGNSYQYITVNNATISLDIEDKSCYIDKEIEGNLRIVLVDTAANNLKKKQKYLNVKTNLSVDNTVFYIINHNNVSYPLNYIECDIADDGNFITNYHADLKSNTNEWVNTSPLTMFNYLTTKEIISEKRDTKVSSYSIVTNDNDETENEKHDGFGNSGYFTINKKVENGSYYIIAITGGNVRTISPVYNFPTLNGFVNFGVYTSKLENGTTKDEITGKDVIEYKTVEENKACFGISNIDENTYYFNNYSYTLNVLIDFDETNKIETEGTIEKGNGGVLYADLDDNKLLLLKSYFNRRGNVLRLNTKTTFTAIDCTGLQHIFGIDKFLNEDKYVVTWNLNNDNASWYNNTEDEEITNEDVSKSYTYSTTYALNDSFHNGELPVSSDTSETFVGWSTDMNTTWDDSYSLTNEGFHKPTDKISATVAQIWYGIWHKIIKVTFTIGEDGNKWKDGTIDDIVLTCDGKNQCKLSDSTKMNPQNVNTDLGFDGWLCDDETVVISEDWTITTDHDCVVYPKWVSVGLVAETNHGIISGDGDTDEDYTKIYYYLKGSDKAENVTLEKVALEDGELEIQFTEISTIVENGKNIKTIKINANDVNSFRYYRFRAKNNVDGTYSDIVEIKQIGRQQIILPEFDYLTFTYNWKDSDGSDLDSATVIRNSHIPITDSTTLDDYFVGFCGSTDSEVEKYIKHGGDNTDSGAEGALINMQNLLNKDYLSDGIKTLYCDIYANWYGERIDGNVSIDFNCYKGNTGMTIEEHKFIPNEGTELISSETISEINVYAQGFLNAYNYSVDAISQTYTKVATLEYDVKSKTSILSVIEEGGRYINNIKVTIDGAEYTDDDVTAPGVIYANRNVGSSTNQYTISIFPLNYSENGVSKTLNYNLDYMFCTITCQDADGKMKPINTVTNKWCSYSYNYNNGRINLTYNLQSNTFGKSRKCTFVFSTNGDKETNYIDITYNYTITQSN